MFVYKVHIPNHIIGEEFERENPVSENHLLLAASDSLEIQPAETEANDGNQFEDLCLIARARPVGVQYEFPQHDVVETEDGRTKRQ